MRNGRHPLLAAAILLAAFMLAACGSPGIDRVDVTWETDPPPRWGLYPGYRQEIPCPPGAVYRVDVFSKGKTFTGGVVAADKAGLAFRPAVAGAGSIAAENPDAAHMNVYATLRDGQGRGDRQLVLRIARNGDKIFFEFPKQ